jgi:3-methyl-2-oxobutanoate hydroxymethyltransferase
MQQSSHMMKCEPLRKRKAPAQKICALTAYDAPTARVLDEAGIDMLFVGDSVGTNVLGYASEREVTLNDIAHHVAAVRRGAQDAVVLADLPFSSYDNPETAFTNASTLIRAGASLVKVEGANQASNIRRLTDEGITVCAHLGFTPQTLSMHDGKARVQARSAVDALALVDAAEELQSAGAAFLVLELVPDIVAKSVTDRLHIPTIGIGAGRHCDGQVLIVHDVLGLSGMNLKLAKQYANGHEFFVTAFLEYQREVRSGIFPGEANSFRMTSEVEAEFLCGLIERA